MKKAQINKTLKPVVYKNPETTSELAFPVRFNFENKRVDTPVILNEAVAGFKEEIARGIPPSVDTTKLRYGIAQALKPLTKKRQEAEEYIKKNIEGMEAEAQAKAEAEAEAQAKAEAEAQAKAEAKKEAPTPTPEAGGKN